MKTKTWPEWKDQWKLLVLIGLETKFHACKKCGVKTVWYVAFYLDTDTNIKYLQWWCSICAKTIFEEIGPYVPNN